MKKENNLSSCEDTTQDQLPNFNSIEGSVFTYLKGEIYIGTEKIRPELREVLREQARYIMKSNLYEIIRATIMNEAAKAALIQSTDWEQVRFAKALYHWSYVLDNMLKVLTTNEKG